MNNILVVGAHFDDAELGCGGTMAKLASEGKNVYKLTLTDNVTNFKQMNIHVDMESSRIDSSKACEEMRVNEITDFDMIKCNTLVYTTEIMQMKKQQPYHSRQPMQKLKQQNLMSQAINQRSRILLKRHWHRQTKNRQKRTRAA